jgi:hypothetical protein
MRKSTVGIVALTGLAVYGGSSLAQSTPRVTAGAGPITVHQIPGHAASVSTRRAVVRRSHAAWYVGSTSAGTRIDFRLSSSGEWARDFHFGSPPLICSLSGEQVDTLSDGNFPLTGLRVRHGRFNGHLHPEDATPNTPDQPFASVSGHFADQQHVLGTLMGGSRSCDSSDPLTFTATKVDSLPARPVGAGHYAAQIFGRNVSGRVSHLRFAVSRSTRRVTGFSIGRVYTYCKPNDTSSWLTMRHSYPAAGLSQKRDGEFHGVLFSRLTASGRPAGIRVMIDVLFLSSHEATGTVRLLQGAATRGNRGRCSGYETLPWRAVLTP